MKNILKQSWKQALLVWSYGLKGYNTYKELIIGKIKNIILFIILALSSIFFSQAFSEEPADLSVFPTTPPPYADLSQFGNDNNSGSGNGQQFWVDINASNADDAGPGTEAQPWKTFKHASNTAQAGDTVNVGPGVYIDTEPQSSSTMWRAFNPTNSGEEGNPITFRSTIPLQAILKSSAPDTDKAYRDKALAFWSRSDIIYDGFKAIGMVHFNGSQRINFINGEITVGSIAWDDPSLLWGIAIENSKNCIIRNNKVHNLTVVINDGQPFIKKNQGAIMVFGATVDITMNNLVEYNYVDASNNAYAGLANKGGGLRNNLWRNNFVKNAVSAVSSIGSTDTTRRVYDSYYVNNIFMDTTIGFNFNYMSMNTYLVNNTFVRNIYAMQFIANNSLNTVFINNAVFNVDSYISAWQYWGFDVPIFTDLFKVQDFNHFEQVDKWAVGDSLSNVRIASIDGFRDVGHEINSIVSPSDFINPSGTQPEDFKRTAYPDDGIGGVYSTVIGAYSSDNVVIGVYELTDDLIFTNSFEQTN